MKSRTYAIILSCFMLINTGAVNVSAAERNEDHTNYEVSSEKFAARLKTIDGLKYSFDENGTSKGLYTGWARAVHKYNYYRNGKRCAGWQTIDGNKYYFYYEGGYAVGDVQIEDKIYTFDSNGIYTGKSKNAVVYAMNIKEPFYADKLPDSIVIYTYYLYKDMGTFEYDYDTSDFYWTDHTPIFNHIERFNGRKWVVIKPNYDYIEKKYRNMGFGFAGMGDLILPDNVTPDTLLKEDSIIDTTESYKDMLTTPGKYRVVYHVIPSSEESDFEETEFYCYFTVK